MVESGLRANQPGSARSWDWSGLSTLLYLILRQARLEIGQSQFASTTFPGLDQRRILQMLPSPPCTVPGPQRLDMS